LNHLLLSVRKSTSLRLCIIVTISIGLRLYHLNYQSLWIDEIASMNGSEPDLSIQAIIAYCKGDQPPAFFLLLHGWLKMTVFNDYAARLLPTIIGVAGVIAMFFLGREVRNTKVGLIASFLTSINYISIYFSQDVRFYTLVILASALSYLFFIRAVKTVAIINFIFYTLSTVVLLYTHYYGLVVFASQGILFCLLLVHYHLNKKFILLSIASALIITIGIIPWIPVFFADSQIKTFWIPSEPFYFPIKYFYVYFKDYVSCVIFAALLVFYLFTTFINVKKRKEFNKVDFILIGSVFFSFLIPIAYSIIQTPMLQERYTLIVLPAIIVMISLGLDLLKELFQRVILITVCCTSLITLVYIQKYYTKPQKEDWRGITKIVIKNIEPGERILSRHSWYCNYYFKSLGSTNRAIQSESFQLHDGDRAGVWILDGFDMSPIPISSEVEIKKNGYQIVTNDSLYRTRVTHYRSGK